MSTIDTSTWSPDSSLNTDIGGIPLNADASIQQTWQAIQMLMAALKGDTAAIELTINHPDGTTIVATNQTLTVVDNGHAHTIANVAGLQTALDAKAADSGVVHIAGTETVAGEKTFSSGINLGSGCRLASSGLINQSDSSVLYLGGGSAYNTANGSRMELYGAAHSSRAGEIVCYTGKVGNSYASLVAKPDGSLTWNGQPIQTSSDERLKTELLPVPEDVLDAWGEVGWGQFQFLAAVERKGKAARLHLGLIAQRVKAVFAARGLDACQYGLLCHEVSEATEDEPAVDLWMVRYAEALAMEAAFQRRRADRLEARVAALEEAMNA